MTRAEALHGEVILAFWSREQSAPMDQKQSDSMYGL